MVLSDKTESRTTARISNSKAFQKIVYGDTTFKKARIIILDNDDKPTAKIDVQFNPSEYSISRSVMLDKQTELGRDTGGTTQAIKGAPTTLNLSLYFDTVSRINHSGSLMRVGSSVAAAFTGVKYIDGTKKPVKASANILDLTSYDPDLHAPPKIQFVWGAMSFTGKVSSISAQYTMFSPSGTPVKSKINLSITGEETAKLLTNKGSPFQSPDRTKSRTLVQGEQLWMMAHDEYDDPEKWKTIAKANNILNPRKIEVATNIKVPSIK